MEPRKSILLVAILFIVGLIAGGLLSGSFTGRSTKVNSITQAGSSIFISPATAKNDEIIRVSVDARSGGASPVAYLRDDQGSKKDKVVWCRGIDDYNNEVVRTGSDEDSTCFSRVTFEYKILNLAPGTYYFEVDDRESRQSVKAFFEVV